MLRQRGIDVYTTVNIQHIESLNDVVAQITHVRVRETVRVTVRGGRARSVTTRSRARGAAPTVAGRAGGGGGLSTTRRVVTVSTGST